jgi:hypothetical protein
MHTRRNSLPKMRKPAKAGFILNFLYKREFHFIISLQLLTQKEFFCFQM